jgi:hypothetical protein
MNYFILQSSDLDSLKEINDTQSNRKLVPSVTQSGESVLPDHFLVDPYWSAYHAFLLNLTLFEGKPVFRSPKK